MDADIKKPRNLKKLFGSVILATTLLLVALLVTLRTEPRNDETKKYSTSIESVIAESGFSKKDAEGLIATVNKRADVKNMGEILSIIKISNNEASIVIGYYLNERGVWGAATTYSAEKKWGKWTILEIKDKNFGM